MPVDWVGYGWAMLALDISQFLYAYKDDWAGEDSVFTTKPNIMTSTMAPTEWREVSPGSYQRSLEAQEILCNMFSVQDPSTGKRHWTMVSAIRLSTPLEDLIDPLRRAWTQLRYEQPNVATLMDRAKRVRTYTVASDPKELESWLKETFIVLDGPSAKEAERSLRDIERPTLYLVPKSQELMFRAHHATMDGMGTIHMWQDLLNILANPKPTPTFGSEGSNLAPVFSIAAKLPPTTAKEIELAQAELANFFAAQPGIGLPFKGSAPGTFAVDHYTFPSDITAAILAGCKAQGLTPTHALHTAIMLTTRRLDATSPPSRSYGAFAPFNLRKYVSSDAKRFSVSSYLSAWFIKTTPPMDTSREGFLALAKIVKDYYVETAKDTHKLRVNDPWYQGVIDVLASIPSNAPPQPPPSAGLLSTIGIVESNIRRSYPRLEVDDFWFALELLSPEIACHSWTFGGELTFQCSYNEGYHSLDEVKNFQNVVKNVLLEGLDVKE